MTASRFSVAIVGAGPVGLTLANLLGKAGIATLLVEANAATVAEPRAVSIDDESLRVIQQLGLDELVRSETVSGYGSEYLGPDGKRFLRVKPQAQPYGHPRRNAFRQPILEAQLRDGLRAHAAVEARFSCRAERLVVCDDHVELALRGADGTRERVTADYLVGCDGARSRTRDTLGAKLSGTSLDERWLILDLEDCPSASPETVVFCDPRRPGIMLPGPRDTRRYEFKLRPDETDAQALAEDAIAALLQAHHPVAGSRLIRKTVYHFHARIADCWGRGRVWLAGDAAHLMPPFAGQGMNGGLRDAANLAWKLTAVVQGRIGPQLLETYQRERCGHIRQMIRLAVTMGAVFAPRTALHGWLTRSAFRALGVWPPARDWFAEMKYKPPPRFDGGFMLEHQLSRRGAVGRMLPQPRLAGAGEARLDDLLGDSFALIGVGLDTAVVHAVCLGEGWDPLVTRRFTIAPSEAPALRPHAGKLLLVRPDRYVIARFSPAETSEVTRDLQTLLARTWPRTPSVRPIPQGVPPRPVIAAAAQDHKE